MYRYEVFLSYKWSGPFKEWVDKVFYPFLYDIMDLELPTKPQIFKDTNNIVSGAQLDISIRDALAYSKCMVCVISLPYFLKSIWCPTEFSAMLYREEQTGVRREGNHTGFIFPVLFIDPDATELKDKNSIFEYVPLRDLIANFSPLQLDANKFKITDSAFIRGSGGNKLKAIMTRWFKDGIKPVILKDKPVWQEQWNSDQFIIAPYDRFKENYLKLNPPNPPLPTIS